MQLIKLAIVLSLALAAKAFGEDAHVKMLKSKGWVCDNRGCFAPSHKNFKKIRSSK